MAELSWFDRFVGFFSPKEKLRRLQYKAAANILENHQRAYEGAQASRRTEGWKTNGRSAKSETQTALKRLRDRARDLVRNDGYAEKGVRGISTETIGKGIRLKFIGRTQRQERNLNQAWKEWSETQACDFTELGNLNSLQLLMMRSICESGEVIVRRKNLRPTVSNPIPLALEVLEGDYIYDELTSVLSAQGSNRILQGIEFEPNGRRAAYWLYKDHPGNNVYSLAETFERVRVAKEDIAHGFRVDRPGQIRGVSWLAPVIMRLKDFGDYEDAQLMRQKIAACFSAFVKDIECLPENIDQQERDLLEKFEPGAIEYLPPGKDIVLANPPGVENYQEYTSVQLHAIASGLGVPFELLTGDLSQVNFSSARMGWLQFQRNLDAWRENIIIPQLLDKIVGWFLESAELAGLDVSGSDWVWTPPRREMIDPAKEIDAMKTAVRSGFVSLSESIRQTGRDPDQHFDEIKADMDKLDNLQLTVDSDPRKTNGSGALQRTN